MCRAAAVAFADTPLQEMPQAACHLGACELLDRVGLAQPASGSGQQATVRLLQARSPVSLFDRAAIRVDWVGAASRVTCDACVRDTPWSRSPT